MEASFYPPRHQFNNHEIFDNRLELQHETLKRIVLACEIQRSVKFRSVKFSGAGSTTNLLGILSRATALLKANKTVS